MTLIEESPESKVHGANMGPTWVLSSPDGPHVGSKNLAIRLNSYYILITKNNYQLANAVKINGGNCAKVSQLQHGYMCTTGHCIMMSGDRIVSQAEFLITQQGLSHYKMFRRVKAADDNAGKLQPVFLKRLYLLHICIFSFLLFNASLTTI